MKVKYWSDYMCPYCYIGEANLQKALHKAGLDDKVDLEMKSFQLDPTLPPVSDDDMVRRLARRYKMPAEKAQSYIDKIDRLGNAAGIDMRYGNVRPANTYNAHRLTKYAETMGDQKVLEKLIQLIFKAVFTDNLVISDKDVLMRLAQEAGLKDMAAVEKLLTNDDFGIDVKADEREAHSLGVRSVPYFVIGNQSMPGAYSVEDMEKVLKDEYAHEKEPVAQ